MLQAKLLTKSNAHNVCGMTSPKHKQSRLSQSISQSGKQVKEAHSGQQFLGTQLERKSTTMIHDFHESHSHNQYKEGKSDQKMHEYSLKIVMITKKCSRFC